MNDMPNRRDPPSLLERAEGAEKLFLSGRRHREADLASAVRFFLEFLEAFERFETTQPCVTVFGSSRYAEDHPHYQRAREIGAALARAGYAVMTGGGSGIMEAANRGAKEAGVNQVQPALLPKPSANSRPGSTSISTGSSRSSIRTTRGPPLRSSFRCVRSPC